jgi:hypothetical protein
MIYLNSYIINPMNSDIQQGSPIGAVITGDIIRSSGYSIDARKLIRGSIQQSVKSLSQAEPFKRENSIPFPAHLYRGDSWQVLVIDPCLAMRAALLIRASLKSDLPELKADTRISLSVGRIHRKDQAISFGDGEAYILSGRKLDEISQKSKSTFVFSMDEFIPFPTEIVQSIQTLLVSLDFITSSWTAKQALSIKLALLGYEPGQIARDWPERQISRRVVDYHLARGGWHAVESGVQYYETVLHQFGPPSWREPAE